MSLLPTATYAGATEEFWAQAGSAGSPAGVTRILAGTNVTIFPTSGEGEVTINALGGGGGGVTSVTASGPGIGATPTTGAVVLTNTGVTSVAAGAGIVVSAPTGALTISATPVAPTFVVIGPTGFDRTIVNEGVTPTALPGTSDAVSCYRNIALRITNPTPSNTHQFRITLPGIPLNSNDNFYVILTRSSAQVGVEIEVPVTFTVTAGNGNAFWTGEVVIQALTATAVDATWRDFEIILVRLKGQP